jgi:NADH pyrophosphatase NudC (nudix superfamily)
MSPGGLSTARLGRRHDVMAGYIERGETIYQAIED